MYKFEIELIASIVIALSSLVANQVGASKLSGSALMRFFAVIFLLAICGVSYHAYLQSHDVVFAAISVIATLLMLYFFVFLAGKQK